MTSYLISTNQRKQMYSSFKSAFRLRSFCHSLLVGGALMSLSQQISAVTKLDDTFTPYVGTSMLYDSNLLRSSGLPATPNQYNKPLKDSFIYQMRAGLNVDWHYSLQQFILKAEVNQNWFTAFGKLDYFGHNVLAQWNWAVGSRLKGEMGYKHDESLSSFAQLGGSNIDQILRNLQTEQRFFANGEYQLLPSIYLRAGFLRNEWTYDSDLRKNSNLTQNNGEISVQYRNLSRTIVGFRFTATDGQYARPLYIPGKDSTGKTIQVMNPNDTGYLRTSYNVDWEWKYSEKFRIGGLMGYVQQEYNHQSGLNFSDVVGRIDLHWLSSEKTLVALSLWREINQAFTQNATFVLSQGFNFTPTWIATSKIRVEMPLAYQTQDYLGSPPNAVAGDRRSDDVVDLGVNVIYAPWINTELAFKFNHESRSSNISGSSYDAQTVGINAKVEF